jgi:hypothetical protein
MSSKIIVSILIISFLIDSPNSFPIKNVLVSLDWHLASSLLNSAEFIHAVLERSHILSFPQPFVNARHPASPQYLIDSEYYSSYFW